MTANTATVNATANVDATTTIYCPDCRAAVWVGEDKYIKENPWGSSAAIDQALVRHWSGECPHSTNHAITDVCPDCGQIMWSGSAEYVSNHPWGSDIDREEAHFDHTSECPVAWAAWRAEVKALPHEDPWDFIWRKLQSGADKRQLKKLPSPPDQYIRYWEEDIEEAAGLLPSYRACLKILRQCKAAGYPIPPGVRPERDEKKYTLLDGDGAKWAPTFVGVHYRRMSVNGLQI